MKIFAGGIATETNTSSPIPTTQEDFLVQRGPWATADVGDYPSLNLDTTWGKQARANGYDFDFSLMAFAQPGGVTIGPVYRALRSELLHRLTLSLPVDVVLLNLHGAMIAQGVEDCERDILENVREICGPDTVIGLLLDLHCNLYHEKIAQADVVICYKEYPHSDIAERGEELFNIAVGTRLGLWRPVQALFDTRVVGLFPTTRQPLRALVDYVQKLEERNEILSVSLAHGFQFADTPHVGAKVLAIVDGDVSVAESVARDVGMRFHSIREEIGFATLSLSTEEALSRALKCTMKPVVVADQSDNAGAGAPTDATFALQWVLERDVQDVAFAIFYDPEVVSLAKKVGVGAEVAVRLGGKIGPTSGIPVDLPVTVVSLKQNYMHPLMQKVGEPWYFPAGDVVSLRSGSIDIIVSSLRCQCMHPSVFSDLSVDLRSKKLIIVKSYQHFYDSFTEVAGEIIYMGGEGAVVPDPRRIKYNNLDTTNLFPWVSSPVLADTTADK